MPSKILTTVMATAAATTGLVGLAAAPAWAAGVSPASTAVTATSTNVKFAGTLFGLPFSVTCTNATIKFTTPASGYGPVNVSPNPTFSGCTDNFGGAATITTNSTNGPWQVTAVASPTQVKITMPKGGATFSTATMPSCVVTAAPAAAATITGAYNNTTKVATYTNAAVPFSGTSACGSLSPTGTVSGSFTTSPGVTIS